MKKIKKKKSWRNLFCFSFYTSLTRKLHYKRLAVHLAPIARLGMEKKKKAKKKVLSH